MASGISGVSEIGTGELLVLVFISIEREGS